MTTGNPEITCVYARTSRLWSQATIISQLLSISTYPHTHNDSTSNLLIDDGVTFKKRQTDLSRQTEVIPPLPFSKYTS